MLYKYYIELKNRFFLLITAWVVTIIVCYFYKEVLLFLLIKANTEVYNLKSFYFISTGLMDIFQVYLKLSYFLSNQFLIFIIFYHVLLFMAPALFSYEYKMFKTFVLNFCLYFFLNLFILNYFLIPKIWNFFFSFQNDYLISNVNIFFEAKITDYLDFYINVYFLTICLSQFFLVIITILNFIKNRITFIINTRKAFYFFFLIMATVITPPDILSQICLVVFFILFFELSVFFVILKVSCFKIQNIIKIIIIKS